MPFGDGEKPVSDNVWVTREVVIVTGIIAISDTEDYMIIDLMSSTSWDSCVDPFNIGVAS